MDHRTRLGILSIIFFSFFATIESWAQKRDPVQLNGVVMSNDSTPQLIPNCNIFIRGRNQGTISDEDGFFSIAILPGDTVQFSAIGFKRERFYIPDTLAIDNKGYLAEVHLMRDTTYLSEVVIYPWPAPNRLKSEFMSIQVPTTDLEIAQRNLLIASLRERAAAMGYDASMMSKEIMRQQSMQTYNQTRYAGMSGGTAALMSLSNPFAWAQLFESLKKK